MNNGRGSLVERVAMPLHPCPTCACDSPSPPLAPFDKKRFAQRAVDFLRALGEELGFGTLEKKKASGALAAHTFRVWFAPGGLAVSGEAHLQGFQFYAEISVADPWSSSPTPRMFFRSASPQDPYGTRHEFKNHWIRPAPSLHLQDFRGRDVTSAAAFIRESLGAALVSLVDKPAEVSVKRRSAKKGART